MLRQFLSDVVGIVVLLATIAGSLHHPPRLGIVAEGEPAGFPMLVALSPPLWMWIAGIVASPPTAWLGARQVMRRAVA
jgi:hypothetical protein